jgi:hypothetical protein
MEAKTPNKGNDQQSTHADHLHAFDLYLGLGNKRSARKTAEALGRELGRAVSQKTIEAWVTRHGWVAKAAEIERDRAAAMRSEYVKGAPVAATQALHAIGAVMRLAESLMVEAAANSELVINTVDDLAKVGRLINDAAKLGEILNGRASERVDHTASQSIIRRESPELRAIDAAYDKLESARIAKIDAETAQDIDLLPGDSNTGVTDADFIDIDQGVSGPGSGIDIMRHFNDDAGSDTSEAIKSEGPPAAPLN